jgi:hypothetical protein
MTRLDKASSKVLKDMRHGGQVIADDAPHAKDLAASRRRLRPAHAALVLPAQGG